MQRLLHALNRRAGQLMVAGVAVVSVYNWLLWRRDRDRADQLRVAAGALPTLRATPRVSALVAAWNEGAGVEAHIRSFLALRYPDIQLIICAGGSDDTLARARRFEGERVTVLAQQPGEGKQRALARCLQHASGEIIYLTDADCRFDDEALERLLAPLVNDGEEAATGGSRPLDEQAGRLLPAYLWSSDLVASAQAPLYSEGLLGRNAAVSRAVIARADNLDFPAPTGTDYHLARRLIRAGVKIRHVGLSQVASDYPESLGVYRQKQSRWMRNLLMYGPEYRAWADVRRTAITLTVGLTMVLMPLTTLLLGPLALLCWLLLVAHAWAARLRYLIVASRAFGLVVTPRLLLALLPLRLAECVVCALPALDLLRPRRRKQW